MKLVVKVRSFFGWLLLASALLFGARPALAAATPTCIAGSSAGGSAIAGLCFTEDAVVQTATDWYFTDVLAFATVPNLTQLTTLLQEEYVQTIHAYPKLQFEGSEEGFVNVALGKLSNLNAYRYLSLCYLTTKFAAGFEPSLSGFKLPAVPGKVFYEFPTCYGNPLTLNGTSTPAEPFPGNNDLNKTVFMAGNGDHYLAVQASYGPAEQIFGWGYNTQGQLATGLTNGTESLVAYGPTLFGGTDKPLGVWGLAVDTEGTLVFAEEEVQGDIQGGIPGSQPLDYLFAYGLTGFGNPDPYSGPSQPARQVGQSLSGVVAIVGGGVEKGSDTDDDGSVDGALLSNGNAVFSSGVTFSGVSAIAVSFGGASPTSSPTYLGLTPTGTVLTPTGPVAGLSEIAEISAGFDHNLTLKTDGSVWAWGQNAYGQLGNGTKTASAKPIQVPGLSNIAEVSAGFQYSLALTRDGMVWAWGTGFGSKPVLIPNLANVQAIFPLPGYPFAIPNSGNVQLAQTITFSSIAAQKLKTGALTVTASATGGTVSFVSLTPAVCTVSGSSVKLLETGTCSVEAVQLSTLRDYAAVSATQSFAVTN